MMKRGHEEGSHESDSDSDFGPSAPSAAAAIKKKRRKLPHENLHIAALPTSARYSKSLLHREVVVALDLTPVTDFLITSSADGVVKFWKKVTGGVEFVKQFRAHEGIIRGTSVSADGRSFASCGEEGTVKVFDVVTFGDLLGVIELEEKRVPNAVCWVHSRRTAAVPLLAVSFQNSNDIHIYNTLDLATTVTKPMHVLGKLHRQPVVTMAFNEHYDCVISADEGGMIEYWSPSSNFEKPNNVFEMKSSTDLFDFKKSKSVPCAFTISPTGKQFATYSFPDRKVRVFDFVSGKLYRTYDESIQTAGEMQTAGTLPFKLEGGEFERRLHPERDLDKTIAATPKLSRRVRVIFDESGHFILYGSLVGTKVINILTNRVVKVYGKDEPFRALQLALYQGAPDKKNIVTVEMAASDNPLLQQAESRDAMLVASGLGKMRFYMFTNETEISKSERDVMNEKPRDIGEIASAAANRQAVAQRGSTATLHTTAGDIVLTLYPSLAPKAVENFTTHARAGYYNNVIFHRVIRKFMIQTGDPLGDGTGGESIWGGEFADEISAQVKHDKPYTLSMANAGPNTNGSQFFITTAKTPWLDGKHTIFGRATGGTDVIHRIEHARVKKEKPEEDMRIVSISVT